MTLRITALIVILCSVAMAAILYLRLHAVHIYTLPAQWTAALPPVSLVLQIHENPMDEAWAPIVADILPAEKGSHWAWTNARPHLRFRIEESDGWTFQLHFATAGQVLESVGPQTIDIAINNAVIKTVTAADAREYEVLFRVDPAALRPGSLNDVELRIAPVYIASDGVRLGVLLHSVGFVESR